MSVTKIFKYELILLNTRKLFFRIVSMAATLNRQFKNVYVLFSFRYGKYKEFVQAFIDLSRVLAERKVQLVYRRRD